MCTHARSLVTVRMSLVTVERSSTCEWDSIAQCPWKQESPVSMGLWCRVSAGRLMVLCHNLNT